MAGRHRLPARGLRPLADSGWPATHPATAPAWGRAYDDGVTPRTIIITGASDGIGKAAAQQLAAQGHRVVLVGRSPDKTRAAVEQIRAGLPTAQVRGLTTDFADLAQVRDLAATLLREEQRIDVLALNAGSVFGKHLLTTEGHEATLATNHLGGFLLAELLRDRLIASAPSRIVITSSGAHYRGTLDFENLELAKGYQLMRGYARSKLANVVYANYLARDLEGTGVTANSFHPGVVATNIWRGAPAWLRPILGVVKKVRMISPDEGGARLAYLATSPEVAGTTGTYFDENKPKDPLPAALDHAVQDQLYAVSRRLVGLT